ncbi:S16 family serine protease [Mesobacillus subterraneus]|uniref:Uncharacterized protein n=1 Tax=Mesobacillus subterraneus TaxID=285983 RepID=A0A427TYL9_9BACI|nr:S16 family serine protease [Mesobacillus subterraneus]RSD29531.1 hypothetical protein EJA10_00015 [Mesobacillus subterraneus]
MRVKISTEVKFSIGLILIALLPVVVLFYPLHEEFEYTGNIVPVQELGIDGSVHFTYVNTGVTEKLLDKLLLLLAEEDIQFYPISSDEYEAYSSYQEDMNVFKEMTIANAVVQSDPEEADLDAFEKRINEIMAEASQYYGDSLGLMVAIGLVEEANQWNFSEEKSFTIAGTGTINSDRTIGEVGGIRYKLLAAEQNEVDFFFVPKNVDENDGYLSNQEEAYKVGDEENLSMMIVPVSNLDEAISFLKNVQEFNLN